MKEDYMNMDNWYEVRVDGEKVAAFAPIRDEAWNQAMNLIDTTRYDLYKGKVLSIVEVVKVQTRNEKGEMSFCRDGLRETVKHEEHPTVIEDEHWDWCAADRRWKAL